MKKEKIIHLVCCLIVAILVAVLFSIISSSYISVLSGFVAALFFAFGKEIGDYSNPESKWDWYDLLAGLIGALVGSQIGWFL